ncbi:hypothetical protein BJX68DRAFT_40458 [Aspergillus pseudodeflectus]|uniref:Uncharacterized protein n=1 Tax=Aspergillus pseudodeflectus TaxID=176178 RepID=A0ABR4KPF6_9EURO
MPPKRRKTSSRSAAQKQNHLSPPEHHVPTSPDSRAGAQEHDTNSDALSQSHCDSPTEPMTPEDAFEPFLETDEETPERTEHTLGEAEGHAVQKTGEGRAFAGGSYNALKSYKGQYYSGMAVGGSHTWNYDQGVWKETKEEPDLWRIDYRTNKRRARRAPQGSGAPVGTEYHWLIVGHQHVKKVDANTYETVLEGSKYKLAYKSASSNTWSVPTVKKQREREVELLDDAKMRVQGLPPVSEKVKVEKQEKGQKKLDAMFGPARQGNVVGKKRKAEE